MLKNKLTKVFQIEILMVVVILTIGGILAFRKYMFESNNKNVTIPQIKVDNRLLNKDWIWVESSISEAQKIKPRIGAFSINLKDDGTFSANTDCNKIYGKYSATDKNIKFFEIIENSSICTKSLEANFVSEIKEVQNYNFNQSNQLILNLSEEQSFMIFK